jgi:hypothetical protein
LLSNKEPTKNTEDYSRLRFDLGIHVKRDVLETSDTLADLIQLRIQFPKSETFKKENTQRCKAPKPVIFLQLLQPCNKIKTPDGCNRGSARDCSPAVSSGSSRSFNAVSVAGFFCRSSHDVRRI